MISPVSQELLDEARALADDAFLVYEENNAELINAKYGAKYKILKKDNIRVLLEETEIDQTVTYAGTDDGLDWWENVKACPVRRTDIGYMHDGIADLYAQIKNELHDFLNPEKVLRMAAHSQGAGPLALTAIHAAKRKQPIVAAHTFNGMRFGNGDCCDAMKALGIPLHTWIIGWDRVCHLPPWACNAGEVHYVGLNGRLLEKQAGFFTGRPWQAWFHGRLNHSMETVIDALDKVRL